MRISVCGANNSELLEKVEKHYNVKSINATGSIYESAKVTYDYDNEEHVIYKGCVLDYAENEKDMHPLDEQIILCALDNIDIVYVYINGLTTEEIARYHQFDEFFDGKVIDVVDVNTLEAIVVE
jgi:predicted small secreted protein